jgi:hypothetical protein
MGDILDRIEDFLKETDISSDLTFIPKKNAESVLGYIMEEVKEDKVLLQAILDEVTRDWRQSNTKLLENFYKILEFYGIVGSSQDRKTVLEAKGKTIVRKFVTLKSQKKILELI